MDSIMKTPIVPSQVLDSQPESLMNSLHTWNQHGALNILEFIKDDIIKITPAWLIKQYIPTKFDGCDGYKIGLSHYDVGGGFIRYFNKHGDIYEGHATKLGKNGFGRLIKEHFCYIGYWKNNKFFGNGRKYYKGKLMEEGWFEDITSLKGKFHDEIVGSRKYWENKTQYFINSQIHHERPVSVQLKATQRTESTVYTPREIPGEGGQPK